MKLTTVILAALTSIALAQEPAPPTPAPPSPTPADAPSGERDAEMEKAIDVATKVPEQMGLLKIVKYSAVPIDRNSQQDALDDSDIKPFIPPIMITSDLIMVLFVPHDRDAGPFVAVYVDRKLQVVRGYLIGPRQRER